MAGPIVLVNLSSAVDGGNRGAVDEAGPDAVYAGLVLFVPATTGGRRAGRQRSRGGNARVTAVADAVPQGLVVHPPLEGNHGQPAEALSGQVPDPVIDATAGDDMTAVELVGANVLEIPAVAYALENDGAVISSPGVLHHCQMTVFPAYFAIHFQIQPLLDYTPKKAPTNP